jgi:hypothetical protein
VASPLPTQQQPSPQGPGTQPPPYQSGGFGQPQQQQRSTVPPSSNTGLKIIGVVLACVFAVGLVVIGGIVYTVHRVKTAVVETAKTYGVELPKESPRRSAAAASKLRKPCELLSKEEAASMLREPIERAVFQEESCLYYGPPGLAVKLADEQAKQEIKRAEAPGAPVLPGDMATKIDRMVNANANEMPMLILGVDGDGQAQMTAITASRAIFAGIGRASDPNGKGLGGFDEVPNLGDRAIRLPKLGLNVLTNGTMIRLIPGPVPDGDAKTIEIARLVMKRL